MKGDEVLVMTSLVIIFAVFLRRRRSFIQQMRLMSLQRNNIQWVYRKPQFWFKDLAEDIENPMRSVGL